MFRKTIALVTALGLFAGSCIPAFAGGVPPIPSSSQFSEPSQILNTLNTLIQQLNGNPLGSGGYAVQPGGVVSLGAFCQNAAAGGSPQVCAGARGAVAFTGITVTTTGSTQTLTITNSLITVNSLCNGAFVTAFTAGSAVTPATFVPSAGSLAVVIVNAGTTSNAVTTGTLAFNCFQ